MRSLLPIVGMKHRGDYAKYSVLNHVRVTVDDLRRAHAQGGHTQRGEGPDREVESLKRCKRNQVGGRSAEARLMTAFADRPAQATQSIFATLVVGLAFSR